MDWTVVVLVRPLSMMVVGTSVTMGMSEVVKLGWLGEPEVMGAPVGAGAEELDQGKVLLGRTGALLEMCSLIRDEAMLEASETGQTVVYRGTVWVTTAVVLADSGRLAISVCLAGQLVTVGAQLMMVETWVTLTVRVVSEAVSLRARRFQWK